ncbi:hypothetical protein F5880DRAFT_1539686 [Lentinula raphanica]|nr:hypothetical protein F5880DRAFT_1539686 [Lentinula raphanica]
MRSLTESRTRPLKRIDRIQIVYSVLRVTQTLKPGNGRIESSFEMLLHVFSFQCYLKNYAGADVSGLDVSIIGVESDPCIPAKATAAFPAAVSPATATSCLLVPVLVVPSLGAGFVSSFGGLAGGCSSLCSGSVFGLGGSSLAFSLGASLGFSLCSSSAFGAGAAFAFAPVFFFLVLLLRET